MRRLFGAVLFTAVAGAQQYVIFTCAGGDPISTPVPALETPIGSPSSVAADRSGNVYFASADANSIFKLDPGGSLTRVAGNGRREYAGDGGPAIRAALNLGRRDIAAGLALDHAGNLFIADGLNNRIRKVSPNGLITTVAGGGASGLGDGGPATSRRS
jgi:DNA-binding beta-propeller fold protein YncE